MAFRSRRKWAVAAVSVSVVAVFGLSIEPVSAQRLRDVLVNAYQNNPRIATERARLRSTDELVNQALSNWRPRVVIDGSAGLRNRRSTITSAAKSTINSYPRSASIGIDQNLYRGGRTQAETRRRKNEVLADRVRLSSVEQDVLLAALTAYTNVVRDRAVIDLNGNNERVLKRQLEATRDRFRVGEVTRTDVAQAESRVSRATAELARARGVLIGSQADYQNIIGAPPGKLGAVKPLEKLPASESEAIEQARQRNFDLLFADYTERAARELVRERAGELLPEVTLRASLGRDYDTTNRQSESDTASLIARLSVPLYQSGFVSSRIREAKQDLVQRRNERNQALRDAIERATSTWEDFITARAQIAAFTDEVRAATIALEGVEQEALVGSRTVLNVLDAEQELLNAKVNLVRARRDLVVATYALRSAVGQLTARSLGLAVNHYDPTRNYRDVRRKWYGTGVKR